VAIELPRRVRVGRRTIEIQAKTVPFFHPANGEIRDARTGAKLHAQGVRRGVLDLWLPVPRGGFCGLVIELKAPKNYPSKEQRIWIDFLERMGWRVVVCRSVEECIQATCLYLNSK